jgi:hypothetical protein
VDGTEPANNEFLRGVLYPWCFLHPEIGYTQSMNFVAAVALGICGDEVESAFMLFAALISRLPFLNGFHVEVARGDTYPSERWGVCSRPVAPWVAHSWPLA